jgi:hypothetical protein
MAHPARTRSAPSTAAAPGPDRHAARTAGIRLVVMAVLAAFAKLFALDGLVTPGDAARTAGDISASLPQALGRIDAFGDVSSAALVRAAPTTP